MLDVHIINYNPHPIWCKECIESVQKAIELADYPIKLHITEGGSNFAEERYKAYRLGSYPYVTYVDNDDYVLPNAFQVLKTALEQNPNAIFTKMYDLYMVNGSHLNQRGLIRPSRLERHHLQIFKREVLVDISDKGYGADYYQQKIVGSENVIELEDRVYVWRHYQKIAGVQGTPRI